MPKILLTILVAVTAMVPPLSVHSSTGSTADLHPSARDLARGATQALIVGSRAPIRVTQGQVTPVAISD